MSYLRTAFAFLLVFAGTAQAASNVSSKFDGSYSGTAEPAPAMGAAGCGRFSLDVTITRGILRAAPLSAPYIISGFITEEGYVAAYLTRSGHVRSALDGRWDEGVIVAGFIEADSNCMWVLRLSPHRSGISAN
jgi:hypothetical protein